MFTTPFPDDFSAWDEHARRTRVIAGPGLLAEETPDGTLLQLEPAEAAAVVTAAAAIPEYDSYFKLSLSVVSSGGAVTHTVTVADGATGSNSTAVVNGYTTYSLAPYSEVVSANRLFYLKYTPPVYNSGGGLVSSGAMAISSTDNMILPAAGTSGAFYTQLGRFLSGGEAARVVQDYTQGVAEIRWYVRCSAFGT